MNNITLVGRLTRDVELRYLPMTGTPVANFSIAVDREYTGKDGKKETDFIDIQVFNKTAENIVNYIGKGSLVAIQGSLRIEIYNKDDEKRKSCKVRANRVQFLDSKNKKEATFTPGAGLDPEGFSAIEDTELPF